MFPSEAYNFNRHLRHSAEKNVEETKVLTTVRKLRVWYEKSGIPENP